MTSMDNGSFGFSLPPGRAYLHAAESVEKTKDNPRNSTQPSSPRSLAKLLSHPGCVDGPREIMLQRFEELLIPRRQTRLPDPAGVRDRSHAVPTHQVSPPTAPVSQPPRRRHLNPTKLVRLRPRNQSPRHLTRPKVAIIAPRDEPRGTDAQSPFPANRRFGRRLKSMNTKKMPHEAAG